MPLGIEVGLGPGHIVLDGDSAPPPPKRGTTVHTFRTISIVAKRSPIATTAELLLAITAFFLEQPGYVQESLKVYYLSP